MFARRGENLHSVYVLLFLNIAFFFLEVQDAARYAALFSFQPELFLSGQVWRVITYQFVQGSGSFFFLPLPPAVMLFFSLLVLYFMGAAVEDEWGTKHFILFYLLSTFGSAAAAMLLGTALFGSFFLFYSLLFVYASLYPEQSIYVFYVIPVRVKWVAWFVAAGLLLQVVFGARSSIAVLVGTILGYGYYLLHRRMPVRGGRLIRRKLPVAPAGPTAGEEAMARRNSARYTEMKHAIDGRDAAGIDALAAQAQQEIVAGVNICPPADFKPADADGYCVRCEGFAECSVRYLKAKREEQAAS